MYSTYILKMPVVLVQIQSVWDRYETFVVSWEFSTCSDGSNVFIDNAEWQSYKGKSDYATLLPPISAY